MSILKKILKKKLGPTPRAKTANSAIRKRMEDAVELQHSNDRLQVILKVMADIAMVATIFMAGKSSASYMIKRIDRTLPGATLEMKIQNRGDESTLKYFKSSNMITEREASLDCQLR